MATVIQSSIVEESKVGAVIGLSGETADQLSRQCHAILEARVSIVNQSIGSAITFLLVVICLSLLWNGFVAFGAITELTDPLKNTLNYGFYFIWVIFILVAIKVVQLMIIASHVESGSPDLQALRHSLAEVAQTYRISRKVLAQASAMHEYNHLEEHQRLLLEVRLGTLYAAIAYYEAVVAPLVKKHVPESTVQTPA